MINKIHPTDTWHDVLYAIRKNEQDGKIYPEMVALHIGIIDGENHDRSYFDPSTIGFMVSAMPICCHFPEYDIVFSDKKECLEEYRRLVGEN